MSPHDALLVDAEDTTKKGGRKRNRGIRGFKIPDFHNLEHLITFLSDKPDELRSAELIFEALRSANNPSQTQESNQRNFTRATEKKRSQLLKLRATRNIALKCIEIMHEALEASTAWRWMHIKLVRGGYVKLEDLDPERWIGRDIEGSLEVLPTWIRRIEDLPLIRIWERKAGKYDHGLLCKLIAQDGAVQNWLKERQSAT
ncbi:hypothetical protein CC79DRAFT_1362503 [Sarocladium strictum]